MDFEDPNKSAKDEEILLASLEKPALFKILVDRYQSAFLRKAHGIIGREEDAEDIVQETFVKIYFNAAKFRKIEGIEFKSWAYKILVNTAITKYRKVKKEGTVEFLDPLLYEDKPAESSDLALSLDNKMAVASLISNLPETLKRLVSLYYLEDKSYKDIAASEGMTIPALKMKLFRAKKLLKKAAEEMADKNNE